MNIFGTRLKQLRENARWTKTYTAKRLKLPLTTYANYEYGTREPDINTITAISTLFNTSNDFLMGKTNNQNSSSNSFKNNNFDDASMMAERIKYARKHMNYTQEQLAELLNVKPTTVSGWELGRNEPSIDTLKKLANKLNVNFDYLAGIDNKTDTSSDNDLNAMLDNARSFDGKPMNDTDREIIRTFLKGRFSK